LYLCHAKYVQPVIAPSHAARERAAGNTSKITTMAIREMYFIAAGVSGTSMFGNSPFDAALFDVSCSMLRV
jgi:hypothetical protein